MSSASDVPPSWYYASNGEKRGPISLDEMKALAASGRLRPTDVVWADGMQEWKPARDVSDLSRERVL